MTINYKYIALGILVSYLGLYVYNLTQMPQENKGVYSKISQSKSK